jgi:beta-lactamase class A
MKIKIIFIVVFISFGAFLIHKTYANYSGGVNNHAMSAKKKQAWLGLKRSLENKVRHFNGRVSVVIKDLRTKQEINFNKDSLVPSASLVKIPIMLSYFYAAREGKICLNDKISLKSCNKVGGSKVLGNDPAGSVFTIKELFDPMITQSDNSATNELIDVLGFDVINAYFKKIGLKNTNLARKMMDFKERRHGEENYTTAPHMAFILERLYRKKFLTKGVSEECLALLGEQKINDRIPRKLPKGSAFIAHKTGLENHICHDAGIVFTQKGDFLICVLVKHNNKFAKPAKKLISDIALLTYNYYHNL